ncbi:MAG: VCBS repeat-containing protein [Myxococcota bacterium]|nr:VCBS repeat-containing protein [Myxococcota bacterium]
MYSRSDSLLYRLPVKLIPYITVFTLASCQPTVNLGFQLESLTLRDKVTEIKLFVFDGQDNSLDCTAFDPRGRRAGDAAIRTGQSALYQLSAAIDNVDWEVPNLETGRYIFVFEGWRNGIQENRSFATLLGYACRTVEITTLVSDPTIRLSLLQSVGSTMRVKQTSESYPRLEPLEIADGERAAKSFDVQLLDDIQQDVTDSPVHFRIVRGNAFFDNGKKEFLVESDENGVARAFITAGIDASFTDDGLIEVQANAPGFSGGPINFFSSSVPTVKASINTISLAQFGIDLGPSLTTLSGYPNYHPLIAADLDNNGSHDLITAVGDVNHRIVIIYRGLSNQNELVHVGPEQPGVATAMTMAQISRDQPKSILVTANRRGRSPEPHLYRYAHNGVAPSANNFSMTVTSTQMSWSAIAISAYDIDNDGDDDLGMVRCAAPFSSGVCRGGTLESPDNELAIIMNENNEQFRTAQRLRIPNTGGFRQLGFADLNQDQVIDIVTTMTDSVGGFCGQQIGRNVEFIEPFNQTATLGQVSPLAIEDFNGDEFPDVAFVGGITVGAAYSELRYLPGCRNCGSPVLSSCGVDIGPPSVPLGTRSLNSYQQDLAVADLNGDGRPDAINLHRTEGNIYIQFMTERHKFGRGPTLKLSTIRASELAFFSEEDGSRAAVIDPDKNSLSIIKFERD